MRTNIDIDDKLMRQAMKATGTTTKEPRSRPARASCIDVHVREKQVAEAHLSPAGEGRLAKGRREMARLEEWFRPT